MIEKRRALRITTKNVSADLSNKYFAFCGCNVSDISSGGLCIENIPKRIISKTKLTDIGNITAIVEYESKHIRLNLVPKWVSPSSAGVSIGFELADESSLWNNFIRSRTSLLVEKDVWGIRGLKNNREIRV